mmetsp:Transcript_88399/g.250532  ORF Transcript_88399/g.250532 Transcript_88399/m.250532 type:complete len:516 (-) Transcript_88399:4-1551(-)
METLRKILQGDDFLRWLPPGAPRVLPEQRRVQHVCVILRRGVVVGAEQLRGRQRALQLLAPGHLLDGNGDPQPEPELELRQARHHVGEVRLGERRVHADDRIDGQEREHGRVRPYGTEAPLHVRPLACKTAVRDGGVQRRREELVLAGAAHLRVQAQVDAAPAVAEGVVEDAVQGQQPGDLQGLALILGGQHPAGLQRLDVPRAAADLVVADPDLRVAAPRDALRQGLVRYAVDPLRDAPPERLRHRQRLPERRLRARDEVVPAHRVQVVVHEDVREPLLGLAPGPYHLPDVEKGRYPGAVVEDVPRHIQWQPGLWTGVVQQPREGRASASALRDLGSPGPDAPAAVVRDPHEALLLLVGPLQARVAASPVPKLAVPNGEDPVPSLRVVYQGSQHRRQLGLLLGALAHDDRVPYGIEPVPPDELREALVERRALAGRGALAQGLPLAERRTPAAKQRGSRGDHGLHAPALPFTALSAAAAWASPRGRGAGASARPGGAPLFAESVRSERQPRASP